MDVQIVIFLTFISVTLVFNSIVIWFAYKAFANITNQRYRDDARNSDQRRTPKLAERTAFCFVSGCCCYQELRRK